MQTKTAKIKETLRRALARPAGYYRVHPMRFTAWLAVALCLVLEILGRHSLVDALRFLAGHPVHFLTNAAIILATLSVSFLFRRRRFLLPLLSILWLILGFINCVVRCFRATPLGASDVLLIPSGFSIIGLYLDMWLIVLLALAVLAGLVCLVRAFLKSEATPPDYRRATAFVLVSAALAAALYGGTVWGREEERVEAYRNLIDAYDHYGFVYCFWTGALDRGIGEPEQYGPEAVEAVLEDLDPAGPVPETLPDIVMVQLESFFDVDYLGDVTYDEDPIPVFRSLKENYASGFLTVPSVGAGTANTEFEVLSGMSLDFFGMGEYPYMTVLQEQTCETVAADLKKLGYTAHAFHNNTGAFYSRNVVFSQLGFDTYTSLEFMNGVTYNPIGWARDETLLEPMLQALDQTDGPGFLFAITVQGHGKYQRGVDSVDLEKQDITWADDEEDEDALAYYLSQLKETDEFIGRLVEALSDRDRPAVLVLYGDHLPNFDIGSEQLKNGDIFQTEYVIWDNMGLPETDADLNAYQLSASVLERLGITGGILSRYHQQRGADPDYERGLELLEYDMLYGEKYCYGGAEKDPYAPSDLRMGLTPLTIGDAAWADGVLTVTGTGYSPWSRVSVDGDELETALSADGTTLTAERKEPPEPGSVLTVRQRAVTMAGVLAESGGYVWPG